MTVLTHKGGQYASQLFGCIVCNTATTGYDWPKRCVVFVYLKLSHTICWVLLTLYSFQYSLSEMDLFLFPFLGMLIILFLYLSVASLLSLVYVFVSPTIFSLYSVVFMITMALPLSAGNMMMELSCFSVCIAILSPC